MDQNYFAAENIPLEAILHRRNNWRNTSGEQSHLTKSEPRTVAGPISEVECPLLAESGRSDPA